MGAKACIYSSYPRSNIIVDVGNYVHPYLGIENCGDTKSLFFIYKYVDGVQKIRVQCNDLAPGSVCKAYGNESDFTMPDRTVKVRFTALVWRDNAYRTDVDVTYTLTPRITKGAINVTSTPGFAKVYLNGVYKGTTTQKITGLDPGTYSVKVTKSGYHDQTKSVTVYANQTTDVHFTLTAECTCTSWVSQECVRDYFRRKTRICTPSGCDVEEKEVYDESCAPPERKDTKLTCYDKETAKGASVDLEAKLEVATFPYVDIEYGTVKFYIDDSYIGNGSTDGNGKASVSYTPPIAGAFTIKAVFEAAGDYNASECTATLTVEEVIEKKDTKICDFDISDEEGSKTTLIVGTQYAVGAYLCWKNWLGGCAEIAKGCDTGYEVEGRTLKFVKADGTPIDGIEVTTSDIGWGAFYWTPTQEDVGTYDVKLKFDGDSVYNASESKMITLTVAPIEEPHAEIIEYPESIPPGDYDLGWDYHLKTKIKNIGSEKGEFRLYIYIDDIELGYAPFLPYWKDLNPGESADFDADLSVVITADTKIELKAWEETKYKTGGEPDHAVVIPVTEVEPSLLDMLIKAVADFLGISETKAKMLVYGTIGVVALIFILNLVRR